MHQWTNQLPISSVTLNWFKPCFHAQPWNRLPATGFQKRLPEASGFGASFVSCGVVKFTGNEKRNENPQVLIGTSLRMLFSRIHGNLFVSVLAENNDHLRACLELVPTISRKFELTTNLYICHRLKTQFWWILFKFGVWLGKTQWFFS